MVNDPTHVEANPTRAFWNDVATNEVQSKSYPTKLLEDILEQAQMHNQQMKDLLSIAEDIAGYCTLKRDRLVNEVPDRVDY